MYPADTKIMDFGGADGCLADMLKSVGFIDVSVCNVGESLGEDNDLIIASNVIEHVYDLDGMMDNLTGALKSTGHILSEVPEAYRWSAADWPPILDFHHKHINHFCDYQIDMLFANRGLNNIFRQYLYYSPLNATLYRSIHKNNGYRDYWDKVKMRVINYTDIAVRTIQHKINEPVIIWGLGDVAWHIIAHAIHPEIQIAGLIDNDRAFRGATMKGVPILEKPQGDEPILLMAQGQKQMIKDRIKREGYKNRVIDLDELIEEGM